MRDLYDAEAKERMKAGGGDRKSETAKSGVEKLPHPIGEGKSRDIVGRMVGVSGKTIDAATKGKGTMNRRKKKKRDWWKIIKLLAGQPALTAAPALAVAGQGGNCGLDGLPRNLEECRSQSLAGLPPQDQNFGST
mgnify:CR=1 FL=1